MHELSIMQSVLHQVSEETRKAGSTKVHEIRLRVGTLSGVVAEALQFAFEAVAPGTPAEGAKLTIETVPARFWCDDCRSEFASPDMLAECPQCHKFSRELRAGRELELAALEVESA